MTYNIKRFALNKIAYHNSCNSNMVSLNLDSNTHMSGQNGAGKTSRLNGVQIGFLEHTSFRNIERKYYFLSSDGKPFSPEETCKFYFPESNSFILYEFENHHGVFTQIVYKGQEDLSIERAFVPLSMSEIYHWFWEFEDDDELGKPTNITRNELITKIKSIPNHKIYRKASELKKVLYTASFVNDNNLYAIAHINENRSDNMSDIFKLSSNASNIKGEVLRKTFVSLLNSTYQNNEKDSFDYTPTKLIEEYESLKKDKESITKKKNYKNLYLAIKNQFENISIFSKEITTKFNLYQQSAEHNNYKAQTLLSELEKENVNLIIEQKKLRKVGEDLKSDMDKLTGTLNSDKVKMSKLEADVKKYKDLLFGEDSNYIFFQGDTNRILSNIRECMQDLEEELKAYKDIDKVILDLKKLKIELNKLKSEKSNINTILNANANLLVTSDLIKEPSKLVALNNAFANLTTNLDPNTINKINNFIEIFDVFDDKILLKNVVFGSLSFDKPDRESMEKRRDELEITINSLEAEINKKNKIIQNTDINSIEKAKKELADCRNDEKIIFNGEDKSKEYDEYNKTIKENENKKIQLNKELDEYRKNWKSHSSTISLNIEANKSTKGICEDNVKIIEELKTLKVEKAFNYDSIKKSLPEDDLIENIDFNDIKQLKILFKSVEESKDIIKNNLSAFIKHNIISDPSNLLVRNNIEYNELRNTLCKDLEDAYVNLDGEEEILIDSFNRHAEITLELSNNVEKQISHFKSYIRGLNNRLDEINISNIDNIRIKVDFHPKVLNFIETIKAYNLEGDDAISSFEKGFPDKLRQFIFDMKIQDNKSIGITTDDIVNSVYLEYYINGEWTSKDGSTGQSMVAKVALLSLFIREVCGDNINLSIPVNLDETGSVDQNNILALHKVLKENALILFSASPELQISSDLIFNTMISFDDNFTSEKDRLLSSKRLTTYHYNMGSMLSIEDEDIYVVEDFSL